MNLRRLVLLAVLIVVAVGFPRLAFAQNSVNITVEVKLPITTAPFPNTLVYVTIYDATRNLVIAAGEHTFTGTNPPYSVVVSVPRTSLIAGNSYRAEAQVGNSASLVRSHEGPSALFTSTATRTEVQAFASAPNARIIRSSTGLVLLSLGLLLAVGSGLLLLWRRQRLLRYAF